MTAILKPVKQKLSHEIAQQIARDIIDEGLQEGDFLGREPELLKRYSISRDTFREAIRVLEWQGLAKTTRPHCNCMKTCCKLFCAATGTVTATTGPTR